MRSRATAMDKNTRRGTKQSCVSVMLLLMVVPCEPPKMMIVTLPKAKTVRASAAEAKATMMVNVLGKHTARANIMRKSAEASNMKTRAIISLLPLRAKVCRRTKMTMLMTKEVATVTCTRLRPLLMKMTHTMEKITATVLIAIGGTPGTIMKTMLMLLMRQFKAMVTKNTWTVKSMARASAAVTKAWTASATTVTRRAEDTGMLTRTSQ
mmetsp:Transcript_52116/g.156411  ORF Transcript_52116/g.156411 Transcript_52116/m.156411 type:complete len:209 (-) Transcript_52116:257-883(-)